MCFVWIWEQTAIISIYIINWLVCITETECVYCAVRNGSLYILHFYSGIERVDKEEMMSRHNNEDREIPATNAAAEVSEMANVLA